MVWGIRNVDRTNGDSIEIGGTSNIGGASAGFTRLFRIFSRRVVSEPPRVCKPRIYRPGCHDLDDEEVELGFPDGTDVCEMRSELLARIQICYQQAAKASDAAGFCFGLLDPLSNIVVNTFVDTALVDAEEDDDDQPTCLWYGRRQTDQIGGERDMNQRSLDGLLAFLAGLFPHLSDAHAVWYLHKAKADPLVAARIIIRHRRMDHSFRFGSDATAAAVQTALRCAAAAAHHPSPRRFLTGWRMLSPSLKKLAAVLSASAPDVSSNLFASMESLLEEAPHAPVFDLSGSWDLASSRLVTLSLDLRPMLYPGRTVMRRMLLNLFCPLRFHRFHQADNSLLLGFLFHIYLLG